MRAEFRSAEAKNDFDDCFRSLMVFLSEYKADINAGEFSRIYNAWTFDTRSYLTYTFLNSGIDPLQYMTEIPINYMSLLSGIKDYLASLNLDIHCVKEEAFYNCGDLGEVNLSNVENICNYAFSNCYITTLHLSEKLTKCRSSAFEDTHIEKIIFNGTSRTFIDFYAPLFENTKVGKVICKDGELRGVK